MYRAAWWCLQHVSLLLVAAIAQSSAQQPSLSPDTGSCPPLGLEALEGSLEGQQRISGLVAQVLLDVPEAESADVRILDFHMVCESAGLTRDTVTSASVIVSYECTGRQCEGGGAQPVNLNEQFTFQCSGMRVPPDYQAPFLSEDVLRRATPAGSFATVPERECGRCFDPANGIAADDVTHCIGELASVAHIDGARKCC